MEHFFLDGVRVLDFSRLLPGPFATLLLADMGAEVIKIEDPNGGDYARYYPPFINESGVFFEAINRNKLSVTLNLKAPQSANPIRRLIQSADVIVESFRPGVMDALGLGYDAVKELKPDIVYVSISGYGQSGPKSSDAGHDLNFLALSGLLDQNRSHNTVVLPGFQIADLAGGALFAAMGALAALFKRERSGVGTFVDVSMTEGAMSLLAPHFATHAANQGTEPGSGMLDGGIAAYNIYQTSDDRFLAVGALEPKFWAGFVEAVDPSLVNSGHTEGNRENIEAVASVIRSRTLKEWTELFAGLDVCVEPVLSLDEVLLHPLHQTREAFFELNGVRHLKSPLTQRKEHRQAPVLGADTDRIFSELGVNVSELRSAGVCL